MEKEKEALRLKIKSQEEIKQEQERNVKAMQTKLAAQFDDDKTKIAKDSKAELVQKQKEIADKAE